MILFLLLWAVSIVLAAYALFLFIVCVMDGIGGKWVWVSLFVVALLICPYTSDSMVLFFRILFHHAQSWWSEGVRSVA